MLRDCSMELTLDKPYELCLLLAQALKCDSNFLGIYNFHSKISHKYQRKSLRLIRWYALSRVSLLRQKEAGLSWYFKGNTTRSDILCPQMVSGFGTCATLARIREWALECVSLLGCKLVVCWQTLQNHNFTLKGFKKSYKSTKYQLCNDWTVPMHTNKIHFSVILVSHTFCLTAAGNKIFTTCFSRLETWHQSVAACYLFTLPLLDLI